MSEFVSFPIEPGSADTVLVEIESEEPRISPVSRTGEAIECATTSFTEALSQVRKAASAAVANFRDMDARPDKVEIEFGIKLNAEAGAIIAKSGVTGHLKVKLIWDHDNQSD